MRRFMAWLAAVCLCLTLAACRPAARPADPQNPPPQDPVAAGLTPQLAGGPEDGNRPHYDPPKPPEFAYMRGDRRYRNVSLTFDDGPDPVFTPRILDVLSQHGVRATFFLIGTRVKAHPQVVRRIVREGHDLGNHSWDHAYLPKLKPPALTHNLKQADAQIRQAAGQRITLFRPPYGSVTADVGTITREMGYRTVLWNVDSLDWKKISHDEVAQNVLPNVRNGSIVLFHSAGGKGEDLTNTVRALPLIIRTLRGQGYKFVTVTEMLKTGNPRPGVW